MARKDAVEGVPHVVTSAVEHPAVTKCLQQLEQLVSLSTAMMLFEWPADLWCASANCATAAVPTR